MSDSKAIKDLQVPNTVDDSKDIKDLQVPNATKVVTKPKIVIRSKITEDMSIIDIARKCYPANWKSVFNDSDDELQDISDIITEDEKKYGKCLPLRKDIFSIFHILKPQDVRVILIGQDPYPQVLSDGNPRATGMSFSVRKGDEIPSSLKNMYKELSNTIKDFKMPNHGDLTNWAKQGILMLNMCLTVRKGSPESHRDIWLGFIRKVLIHVTKYNPNCVTIMLGAKAKQIIPLLGDNFVQITAVHPSGLSANKGFFGSDIFNKTNKALESQGKEPINWQV